MKEGFALTCGTNSLKEWGGRRIKLQKDSDYFVSVFKFSNNLKKWTLERVNAVLLG